LHIWILVSLIAAPVVLMAVCGVTVERLRARRGKREAQLWADLASRHQELDQELEKVWQSW
jgi:hypothetical protein